MGRCLSVHSFKIKCSEQGIFYKYVKGWKKNRWEHFGPYSLIIYASFVLILIASTLWMKEQYLVTLSVLPHNKVSGNKMSSFISLPQSKL